MKILTQVPDPHAFRVMYLAEAEEAMASPGVWFRLQSKDTAEKAWSAAAQIRAGRRAAFRPAGSFEAVARDCDVLIKYVGECGAG